MTRSMGFDFGLNDANTCYKRKNRWLFKIPSISADGVTALPPSKAARPSFSFKEIEAQHLIETIYFPGKPEWKPVNLTLYDIKRTNTSTHVIFDWLKKLYNPETGDYFTSTDTGFKIPLPIPSGSTDSSNSLSQGDASLELYDGCGEIIEKWIFENVWPQAIDFGDLDMQGSEIITCDLTLRYDRAYIES